jgi:hypothetical protein
MIVSSLVAVVTSPCSSFSLAFVSAPWPTSLSEPQRSSFVQQQTSFVYRADQLEHASRNFCESKSENKIDAEETTLRELGSAAGSTSALAHKRKAHGNHRIAEVSALMANIPIH